MVLTARYYKRIGGHTLNVLSSIVMGLDGQGTRPPAPTGGAAGGDSRPCPRRHRSRPACRKRRIDLGMPFGDWLEKALPTALEILAISSGVAAAEHALPESFHGDPADRLIASTAIAHRLTLLTPDHRITFHRVCSTVRYKWPGGSGRRGAHRASRKS